MTAVLVAALFAAGAAHAQTPAAPAAKTQPAGAEGLFVRWDTDKNQALSLAEFKVGWQEVETSTALRKLHENFMARDTDKSGGLEAAEYAKLELVKQAGAAAPPLASFDTDNNQRLDFKEYMGLINATVKKP
jgi:Ca2+-binding EF-hand superfamily protein